MRCRNNGNAQFVKCYNGKPEFVPAFENGHDNISFFQSQGLKIGRRLVGVFFYFGKCKFTAIALVIGPKQCFFVWFAGCPRIHYIVSEVEMFRHNQFIVCFEIFKVGEFCLF